MFLLNENLMEKLNDLLKFTIQNVSIKLNYKRVRAKSCFNLQYKMFLLNGDRHY